MVFTNTVVLFSFVIPFYYLVSITDGSEGSFIDYDLIVFEGQNAYNNIVAGVRDIFPHIEYIDDIWFIGVLIFIAMKILMYLYTVTHIKRTSFMIQSDVWASVFEKIMEKYTTHNVLLMGNNKTTSPFTVGILHKYIVIPAIMINALDEEEIEFVLSHECYHAKTPEENFEVFIVDTSNDITYEIIYVNSEIKNMDADVEPRHIHTIKDAVIKIHEKHIDGSCTTTYYEGRQCTGCGLTWRGDFIKTVTENPCMH